MEFFDLVRRVAEDLDEEFEQDIASSITPTVSLPDEGLCFRSTVTRFENALILQALKRSKGNKNKAASLLHLNRTTLVEKIKRKQIDPESSDD